MGGVQRSENINKLRILVDELEKGLSHDDGYKKTLKEIQVLIKDELKLIDKLVKPDNKLKHYEGICKGILTMISSTKL